MTIHSFLKATQGDPDWQYTPEIYFGKEFKIINAASFELAENSVDSIVLRQTPHDRDLLAKHITICVKADAALNLIIINDVDDAIQQVFLYDIHLDSGATLELGLFASGGKLNKHILQVSQDDNSEFLAYGVAANESNGDTEIITKVVVQGEQAVSKQLFLGIAGSGSQSVFQAMTIIEPASDQSDILIDNSNLIVGPGGRCYSKPEIFSDADLVIAQQNSSVNSIAIDQLLYLQSRGISAGDATNITISNFLSPVIDIVSDPVIQEEIKNLFNN